jgi:hypothetical protein
MRIALLLISTAVTLAAADTKSFTAQQRRWWAFQPVVKPAAAGIDPLVRAKLAEKGIKPNPPADRITLLRRVTFDLIGLPPTLEETQAFLADTSPDAWEKVVDRLLASPRYGERWARHWLDLARYADSEGFKSDETRPNVWRYRDYVIDSFNQDKPYDRFIKEQIAGDELYPGDPQALIATGFNRHFPDESNARNLLQRRQELLNDITDTVAATFMGLTYGCARCHDHKFDPILQKDYYRLQAFFANTRIEDHAPLLAGPDRDARQRQDDEWDAKTKNIRAEMSALLQPHRDFLSKENFDKFPPEIQAAVTAPPGERTPIQWQMYYKAKPYFEHPDEEVARRLKGDAKARYAALQKELAQFDSLKPPDMPVAQVMIDNTNSEAPKTFVLSVGAYDAPKEEVQPGFLSILDPAPAKIEGGRRSTLANWLADPKNPLTARVMANRIWHYHFGRGIAATPSDFGTMGERPANRELLDYLAAMFTENGWSVKKLHRLILLSETYRESSAYDAAAAGIDPEDKYLWRYPRHRLEGEAVRDSMLAASGLLNLKMGGPGVFPPLPPGMTTRGGWKKNEDPSEARRRSVYIFVRRNTRYPMLESFDMPDTHESCSRRSATVTPSQSLELMNSAEVLEWARAFAERVMNDPGLSEDMQIDRAWKFAYSRPPGEEERRDAREFLRRQTALVGGPQAAFADLCHMLLNSNEFMYVN